MNKLWIGLGTIVVLLVAILVIQSLIFPANSWRYRFTMEVETPEGVRTGFVVRQINVSTGIKIGDASGARMYVRGEALAIDLGQRGILFGLIDEGNGISYDVFLKRFLIHGPKMDL